MEKPKLRPVETFPVEQEGGVAIGLRDPTRFSPAILTVSQPALFMMSLMDGTNTVRDIQGKFEQQYGERPEAEVIEGLIGQLDEQLFLESERFLAEKGVREAEFRAQPTRPSPMAGVSFPADPGELWAYLDAFFTGEEGPGRPDPDGAPKDLAALVAPHIDIERGGVTYAHAYKRLIERSDAETYIVLGTSHFGGRELFTGTEKGYETPFGLLENDVELTRAIRSKYGPAFYAEEYNHKDEHSVEFQALFLKYAFGERPVRFVPILCGSFHHMLESGVGPGFDDQVLGFVEALAEAIDATGRRTCLIAGADLAHVGMAFGDERALSAPFLYEVDRADREFLGLAAALDVAGLYKHWAACQDDRKVCGYPNITTLLMSLQKARKRKPGEILRYEQCVTHDTQTCVTIAGLAYHDG